LCLPAFDVSLVPRNAGQTTEIKRLLIPMGILPESADNGTILDGLSFGLMREKLMDFRLRIPKILSAKSIKD